MWTNKRMISIEKQIDELNELFPDLYFQYLRTEPKGMKYTNERIHIVYVKPSDSSGGERVQLMSGNNLKQLDERMLAFNVGAIFAKNMSKVQMMASSRANAGDILRSTMDKLENRIQPQGSVY